MPVHDPLVVYETSDFPCPKRHIFHEVNACISEFDQNTRRRLQVVCPVYTIHLTKMLIQFVFQEIIRRGGGRTTFALRDSCTHLIIGR